MGTKKASPKAVKPGSVFATLMEELVNLTAELDARRRFDDQVTAFLKERGLVEEFEKLRAANNETESKVP